MRAARETSAKTGLSTFGLLDGQRGVGAILVVMGHTAAFWSLPYVPSGAVCVDLFFLLSGFVIAFAYEPRFAQGMGVAEFMTHRMVRLYPLYILGVLISAAFIVFASIGDPRWHHRIFDELGVWALPQALMLPAVDPDFRDKLYPLNGPAWTLLSEILVNLVYVLVWRWLSTRVLIGVVVVAAIVLAVVVFQQGGIDSGASWRSFAAGPARGFFGFFAGVLVYRLVGSPQRPPSRRTWWAVAPLLVIPALCFVPVSKEMQPWFDCFFVIGLGMPLLWLSQALQPPKALTPLFLVLGRVSYAAYILHHAFREMLVRLSWRFPDTIGQAAPWTGLVTLLTVLVVAFVAERYYDRPVRRFIVGLLKARERARALKSYHTGAGPQVHAE